MADEVVKRTSLDIFRPMGEVVLRGRATPIAIFEPVPNMPEDHPMIMKQIDWARLKRMCAEFVFIHSDNDPWGCDVAQGEIMRQNLGGTMAVLSGHGHFGSNIFKQPYQTFPLLRDFCLTETLTPPALLA